MEDMCLRRGFKGQYGLVDMIADEVLEGESAGYLTYKNEMVKVDGMDVEQSGDWFSIEGKVVNLYVEDA